MTSNLLSLDLIPMRADPDDAAGVRCPGCHNPLTLHQPDQQSPDRLVGTCEDCQTWFLVYASAGIMVRLPDEDDLRDA